MEFGKDNGKHAASRKYGVDRKCIREWLERIPEFYKLRRKDRKIKYTLHLGP